MYCQILRRVGLFETGRATLVSSAYGCSNPNGALLCFSQPSISMFEPCVMLVSQVLLLSVDFSQLSGHIRYYLVSS